MALFSAAGAPENSQLLSTPVPPVSLNILATISSSLPSTMSAPKSAAIRILVSLSQSIAITFLAPIALAALTANKPIGPKPCIATVEFSTGPPVNVCIAFPSGS